MSEEHLDNHVAVFGWDPFTRDIIEQLVASEHEVTVAVEREDHRAHIDRVFGDGVVDAVVGRYTDMDSFADLGLERSAKVFINLESDHESLIVVLRVRKLHPDLEIAVVLENAELQETFYVAGVTYAVAPHAIASKVIATHVYEEDVGTFTAGILRATASTDDSEFQQYRVVDDHPFVGQSYDEVFWELKRGFNCALLGLSSTDPDTGRHTLHKMPPGDTVVQAGDYLVLMVHGSNEDALVEMFGIDEGVMR